MAGFHEIIGHEQLIAHLQSAIVMDKVSHAYIINGPKDSGKMMLAQAFAWRCSVRLPSGTGGSDRSSRGETVTGNPCRAMSGVSFLQTGTGE